MLSHAVAVTTLSDTDLLAQVARLAAAERHATAQLIASLAEVDARRLYLGQGCSSLFTYCTQVLHLSEHAAYGRIEAARAARRFPLLLDQLAEGALTLTAISLLAPHLTPENHQKVLEAARHKTKREIEQLVAHLRPQPAVPASIRKLPAPGPEAPTSVAASSSPAPAATVCAGSSAHVASSNQAGTAPPHIARSAVVAPLAPELYKLQVTIGRNTMNKLQYAQDLLRHTIPSGDLAAILDRALTILVSQLERTKIASTPSPRAGRELTSGSRHVPAAVRRAVWARDEGRCTFVGDAGRCTERGFLEFHHVVPYAAGGDATVETIALRCRAHNLYEAELDFGACVPRGRRRQQMKARLDLFE